MFDETYYVKDAWSQWHLGYPSSWPEDADNRFLAGETGIFTSNPSYVVHPPLGKWIIGAGMALFGADSGFGWRFSVALFGTATVLVLYFVARALGGSIVYATVAALFLAVDGLGIVLSRVSILDGLLTFFVVLGFLFVLLDRRRHRERLDAALTARTVDGPAPAWGPVLWNRPWILAAGAALGAATAVKWSGLFVVAAVGVYLVVDDALARRAAGIAFWPTERRPPGHRDLPALRARRRPRLHRIVGRLAPDGRRLRPARGRRRTRDGHLVVGAAAAPEPLALPPGDLRLERQPHLPAQLRQPRVAVAPDAATDIHVLRRLGHGRERLRIRRQRLHRGDHEHREPASCGGRRSSPSSTWSGAASRGATAATGSSSPASSRPTCRGSCTPTARSSSSIRSPSCRS